MNDLLYVDNMKKGLGLTNQLGALICGILSAHTNNKPFVLVSPFNKSYDKEDPCPISEIIDLEALNEDIKKYGITVFDREYSQIKILSVRYGGEFYSEDITEMIKPLLESGPINPGFEWNIIKGDPMPGHEKKIFITYQLNDKIKTTVYREKLTAPINFNLFKQESTTSYWIMRYNLNFYNSILSTLKFRWPFYEKTHQFKLSLNLTPKINVIHVRDEQDGLIFWSRINQLNISEYKKKYQLKCINLIQKYFDKNISIFVLTANPQSEILTYLRNNNYNYNYIPQKYSPSREINAIYDLIMGENCNNVFIGNINPKTLHGSTYSYLLLKRMKNKKSVLLDLDHIDADEFIIDHP